MAIVRKKVVCSEDERLVARREREIESETHTPNQIAAIALFLEIRFRPMQMKNIRPMCRHRPRQRERPTVSGQEFDFDTLPGEALREESLVWDTSAIVWGEKNPHSLLSRLYVKPREVTAPQILVQDEE